MKNNCIFCQISNHLIEAQIVYEDKDIICFLDNDPINIGHVLIIPVNHYLDVDDLPESTAFAIMKLSGDVVKAIKEIFHPNGYSIMQNGGIFNDIGHYHLHIIPRFLNDGFGWTYGENKIKFCNPDTATLIKNFLEKH